MTEFLGTGAELCKTRFRATFLLAEAHSKDVDATPLSEPIERLPGGQMKSSGCLASHEIRSRLAAAYAQLKRAEEFPELVVERFRAYSHLMKMNEEMASHLSSCTTCRALQAEPPKGLSSINRPRVPGTPRKVN